MMIQRVGALTGDAGVSNTTTIKNPQPQKPSFEGLGVNKTGKTMKALAAAAILGMAAVGMSSCVQPTDPTIIEESTEKEPEETTPVDEETPIIDDEETNPIDDEETKPIDDEETKPIVDDETKPVVDDEETKPVVDEETKPVVDDEETKPVVDDEETKPVVDDEETKPVVDDEETKPIGGEEETKPVIGEDEETKPIGGEEEITNPEDIKEIGTSPIILNDTISQTLAKTETYKVLSEVGFKNITGVDVPVEAGKYQPKTGEIVELYYNNRGLYPTTYTLNRELSKDGHLVYDASCYKEVYGLDSMQTWTGEEFICDPQNKTLTHYIPDPDEDPASYQYEYIKIDDDGSFVLGGYKNSPNDGSLYEMPVEFNKSENSVDLYMDIAFKLAK